MVWRISCMLCCGACASCAVNAVRGILWSDAAVHNGATAQTQEVLVLGSRRAFAGKMAKGKIRYIGLDAIQPCAAKRVPAACGVSRRIERISAHQTSASSGGMVKRRRQGRGAGKGMPPSKPMSGDWSVPRSLHSMALRNSAEAARTFDPHRHSSPQWNWASLRKERWVVRVDLRRARVAPRFRILNSRSFLDRGADVPPLEKPACPPMTPHVRRSACHRCSDDLCLQPDR